MVYWTSAKWEGCRDEVRIIEHPDPCDYKMPMASSDGACWYFYSKLSTQERLNYLFSIFVDLVTYEDIPPKLIARAFEVIPEYRHMMTLANKRKGILFEGCTVDA